MNKNLNEKKLYHHKSTINYASFINVMNIK